MNYNKTQLNPDSTFERHVYHRDQFAHYLRWTHVLKIARLSSVNTKNVLDFGCGSGNLAEVFYRNRLQPDYYLGLDIRKQTIEKANEKYKNIDWAEFNTEDLVNLSYHSLACTEKWDLITSFEVIEHIGKQNANKFLQNIKNCMYTETILLISTPVYDEKVGAAANHIIDGEVGEFTFDEMKSLLESNGFKIEKVWGTFASKKDYTPLMNEWQTKMFEKLSEYYDNEIVSNLMAPMFPVESRNCLWKCSLNSQQKKTATAEMKLEKVSNCGLEEKEISMGCDEPAPSSADDLKSNNVKNIKDGIYKICEKHPASPLSEDLQEYVEDLQC